MKNRQITTYVAISTFSVATALGVGAVFSRADSEIAGAADTVTEVTHPRPFELLDVMHGLQRYADKLYFSGQAQNARLAGWYSWKLEQAAANIKNGLTEPYARDGWDTRQLVHMLDSPVAAVNEAIGEEDWAAFDEAYEHLVQTCNGCHVAADHGYVVIKVPDGPPIYSNQVYEPQP